MKSIKAILSIILILCLALSLAACNKTTPQNSEEDTNKKDDLQKVTLILDYVPNTNHTGFYVAKELGYFAEHGLDVEIIEPADNTVTTLIATNKGQFGISYQEDVTYALTAEEPMPIKSIAAIIQNNTSGFATYVEKNITRPLDFEGKTYSGWGALSEEAVIKAVMNADGADFSKLNIVLSDGAGYPALKDKIDIIWLFWAWDGIAAEMAGFPINYMELREFDERLNYYTPVIIANESLLAEDPEMVKNFLAATSKGYEYCIANPAEAAKILQTHVSTYDLEMLTKSQEYLADKYAENTPQWGLMKDEVWDNYTAFMLENGLIEEAIPASNCYTNEFLPQ